MSLDILSEEQARDLLRRLGRPSPDSPEVAALARLVADHTVMRAVADGTSVGVAVLDAELRYRYVNEALAAMNGTPAPDHLGKRLADVVPGVNVDHTEAALRSVLETGRPVAHLVEGTTAPGPAAPVRFWHNAFHRLEEEDGAPLGVVALVLEITEDRRIREALSLASTRLTLFDEAATRIGTTLDVRQTCQELTELLVPRLADLAVVDVLDLDRHLAAPHPQEGLHLHRLALTAVPRLAEATHLLGAPGAPVTPRPGSDLTRCLDEQRPVVSDLLGPDGTGLLGLPPERIALHRRLGLHSACHVPLTARHDVIGVVSLVRSTGSPPFTPQEADLAGELALRAANSIDNAQRYAHERRSAVLLQRALLSDATVPGPGVECARRYLPAGAAAEIGGDWYDTLALPGGSTLLTVGDVMGHGLDAAATMAEYRSVIRTLALQGLPPAAVLDAAEHTVQALDQERVATCLTVTFSPATRTAVLATAGHLPPLLIPPDGPPRLLDLPVGPPLGAGPGPHRSRTLRLPPGAVLLLYTDGLVERRDQDIDQGLAALAALAFEQAGPLESVLDTAVTLLAGARVGDDVSLLAVRTA
ncbi:SpoIIE family protein phosphatase [Kitasatospora sp. NPDC096147]|uniref:SpoIIE family protein phosphatase n=1 Tax=Kitasatospora sp. NPDC096147 TaxID=3364093 RepID=UPI0037FA72BD